MSGLGVAESIAAMANEVFKGRRESRKGRRHTTHLRTGSELIVLNGVHFQRRRIIRHQLPHGFSEHQMLGVFRNAQC